MEKERKQYRNAYVSGSAAPSRVPQTPTRRKAEPRRDLEREIRPLNEKELRKRQIAKYAQENQRKALRFGGLYTLFVVCAVAVTLFSSVNYISALNTKSENAKKIVTLKNQVNSMQIENDQLKLSIDTSIDYDYIYRVATEELGMIQIGANQIINYESGESEYVIQYADVPEE